MEWLTLGGVVDVGWDGCCHCCCSCCHPLETMLGLGVVVIKQCWVGWSTLGGGAVVITVVVVC